MDLIRNRRGRFSSTALIAPALAFALGIGACQSQAPRLPAETSLAQSRAAQAQYRSLYQRWTGSVGTARYGLEAELEAFLVQFPSDQRARMVGVQLALLHVQRGNLAQARRVLAQSRARE